MARQWYRHQIKSLCEFNANLWNFPWSLVYRAWNAVNTAVEQACSISCEWWGSERIMNIFIKQLNTYGIFTWIAANGVELQNGIFSKTATWNVAYHCIPGEKKFEDLKGCSRNDFWIYAFFKFQSVNCVTSKRNGRLHEVTVPSDPRINKVSF